MRPIQLARMDKTRPVVVLTREKARGAMASVTVASVTSRIRGLDSEVPVGQRHGLDTASVINCDDLSTIPVSDLGRVVGYLRHDDEVLLAQALINAFDLCVEELP
ncbi:type II toxin-antitoxin system PemK/MazF family toxin [Nocardioides marmoriginsengisoli]|uniref:Type II toxin-antitoxin system PemK/MazF family toxin n=1 Tax=Nocardioides marmoriginsengisoli TaxID=661483 RepID=A0A3N0CFB4_9ACTN|nr:type II toxin-antitoxin system PemK/MazF family toxin [Nocardioides marmoriginsengisoli]RNL61979.1 type II toxin-antitoxin system PemK/MazF family toxin [Nocardioides marmoriginsengisoli]